ncbi:hypothetical protein lerEdw1_005245, partial [Lerista edwardsae]
CYNCSYDEYYDHELKSCTPCTHFTTTPSPITTVSTTTAPSTVTAKVLREMVYPISPMVWDEIVNALLNATNSWLGPKAS